MNGATITRAEMIEKIKAKQKQLIEEGRAELRRLATESVKNQRLGKER